MQLRVQAQTIILAFKNIPVVLTGIFFICSKQKNKSRRNLRLCVGAFLSSQAAARQVFSALVSLTSVFGMGTGGPSPQSTPTVHFLERLSIIPQQVLFVNTFLKKFFNVFYLLTEICQIVFYMP